MINPTVEGVRWRTQDLEVLPQNQGIVYEIIDGELFVTRAPHRKHQQTSGIIFAELYTWSQKSGLGTSIIAPGIIFADADNIIPDVVWVSYEKLALLEDQAGHLTGAPELVVEILSPGTENERRDREAKLRLYSVRGVQEYWIADYLTKQVEVYRRNQAQLLLVATFIGTDTISSPLLPGFACSISSFFP
jgi:Uma2 family endonuclease